MLTTDFGRLCTMQLMARTLTRPKKPDHSDGFKLHYIPEWAEKRGVNQAFVVKELHMNKGTVSKWFGGALPSEANLPRIADLFGVDIDELFRAPGDNWLRRFFKKRSDEELEKIRKVIELTFPEKKTGTDE